MPNVVRTLHRADITGRQGRLWDAVHYPEFWLLEAAVEYHAPLRDLIGSPKFLQEQWNRRPHGASGGEIARLLVWLAEEGDVRFLRWSNHQANPLPIPTEMELLDWLTNPGKMGRSYELTSQGGARWERFAGADWDRYLGSQGDLHEEYLEIVTTQAETTERAFHYVCVESCFLMDRSAIARPVYRPWQATYWKTLPAGYGIHCRYEELTRAEADRYYREGLTSDEVRDFQLQIQQDREYFRRWYAPHPETPP